MWAVQVPLPWGHREPTLPIWSAEGTAGDAPEGCPLHSHSPQGALSGEGWGVPFSCPPSQENPLTLALPRLLRAMNKGLDHISPQFLYLKKNLTVPYLSYIKKIPDKVTLRYKIT